MEFCGNLRSPFVAKPELYNQNCAFNRAVNQAMLRIDEAQPVATKRVSQRLGFPNASMMVTNGVI